jgi:hypothetical protein
MGDTEFSIPHSEPERLISNVFLAMLLTLFSFKQSLIGFNAGLLVASSIM